MFKRICSVVLLFCILSAGANAAERPKVGLCLSGGGARGAAHIGVLRVLEELNVPVDYIAGTSMGAIIGGLYASGYSLDEIEEFAVYTDWPGVLGDVIPRNKQLYESKLDDANYFVGLEIDRGVKLPDALISAKRLDYMLQSLLVGVEHITDFDQLAIPFRAVTADIATGEMVVLGEGELSAAIRASMAVPGVFSPVEIDGRLLVDGGIARNLPVDVVRAMGADILIVVDISTPMQEQAAIKSAFSIVGQLSRYLTNRNTSEQLAAIGDADILIVPALGDITTGSFERSAEAIEIGDDAARARLSELSALSISRAEYQAYWDDRLSRTPERVQVEFIKLPAMDKILSQYFRERSERTLNQDLKDEPLDGILLRLQQYSKLEDIDLDIIESDGQQGLLISGEQRKERFSTLKFGFDYSYDSASDRGVVLLKFKHDMLNINALGASWSNWIHVGDEAYLRSEYYQPLLPYFWAPFIAPYVDYSMMFRNVYNPLGDRMAEYQFRGYSGGLDVGYALGEYGELRIGVVRGRTKADRRIGDPLTYYDVSTGDGGYLAQFKLDQLDSSSFPTRGLWLDFEYFAARHGMGSEASFDLVDAKVVWPVSIGSHTLAFKARWASSSDDAPLYEFFELGGWTELSGTGLGKLHGNHLMLGSLIYYCNLWPEPVGPLRGIYLGGSLEAGNVWERSSDVVISVPEMIVAGSLFVGTETPLGPFTVGLGHTDSGDSALYCRLGYSF